MRKVVVYMLLSLDGVAEEPGDWMTDFDQPIFDNLARVIGTQETILLGRGTYDYWVGFWPGDGPEPFHSFINGTEKHVFTSRPLDQEWAGTVVVDAPAEEHVRSLKRGRRRRHRRPRQHPAGPGTGRRGARRRVPTCRVEHGGRHRSPALHRRRTEASAHAARRDPDAGRVHPARLPRGLTDRRPGPALSAVPDTYPGPGVLVTPGQRSRSGTPSACCRRRHRSDLPGRPGPSPAPPPSRRRHPESGTPRSSGRSRP